MPPPTSSVALSGDRDRTNVNVQSRRRTCASPERARPAIKRPSAVPPITGPSKSRPTRCCRPSAKRPAVRELEVTAITGPSSEPAQRQFKADSGSRTTPTRQAASDPKETTAFFKPTDSSALQADAQLVQGRIGAPQQRSLGRPPEQRGMRLGANGSLGYWPLDCVRCRGDGGEAVAPDPWVKKVEVVSRGAMCDSGHRMRRC